MCFALYVLRTLGDAYVQFLSRHGSESAWQMVFRLLSQLLVQTNKSGYYAIDSMPVLVCQNARINRCRLFPVEEHEVLRGRQASKDRFFYGFKIHLVVTRSGEPIEFWYWLNWVL